MLLGPELLTLKEHKLLDTIQYIEVTKDATTIHCTDIDIVKKAVQSYNSNDFMNTENYKYILEKIRDKPNINQNLIIGPELHALSENNILDKIIIKPGETTIFTVNIKKAKELIDNYFGEYILASNLYKFSTEI